MFREDFPIKTVDEDKFERATFAKQLAEYISSQTFSSSFAIGLYGPWGSGKTSLANMIIKNIINNNEQLITFVFNPWLSNDPKQLIDQFFKQLRTKILLKSEIFKNIASLILDYSKVITTATSEPITTSLIALGISTVKKHFLNNQNDIQTIKETIVSELQKQKIKLVVHIDDMDRLSDQEIIATFQLVKALADFPNTIYILTFDREIVVKALNNVQHGKGENYLEKIVQLPFEVPMIANEILLDHFVDELRKTIGDINIGEKDNERLSYLLTDGVFEYIRSTRNIHRFINTFSLKYQLLKNNINITDLVGICCIQVFEPKIYSIIPLYQSFLFEGKTNDTFKDLEALASNKKASEAIVSYLFPLNTENQAKTLKDLARINQTLNNFNHHIPINSIRTPECFRRYFSLTLEKDALDYNYFTDIINAETFNEFQLKLESVYNTKKTPDFVKTLRRVLENNSLPHPNDKRSKQLITYLSIEWNEIINNIQQNKFSLETNLARCIRLLLQNLTKNSREQLLLDIFNKNETSISFNKELLYILYSEQRTPTTNNPIVTNDTLTTLEEIFQNKSKAILFDKNSLNSQTDLNFISLVTSLDKEIEAFIINKCETDITYLANIITSHTRKIQRILPNPLTYEDINHEGLRKILNYEKARELLLSNLKDDEFKSLPKDRVKNCVRFLISTNKETSNNFDKIIPEELIENYIKNNIDN